MILGRCGISSTYRYLTKLCKKHYSGNCIQGSCLIDNTLLSSSESLLNRSDRISPILLTLPARMASSSAGDPSTNATQPSGNTNMLMLEKSPYLLQHATNPVEWYPWGDEALAKARSEDKMIFLSVGYSTCHWCHVMEKESFENREIAEIMNKYFVNIKVDREERPDIDKVYMTFIQTIIGHGGWPMSVFLAPDLTPIIGGTYFPPENRYGQPGFKNVLLKIAQKWRENKAELLHSGTSVVKELKRVLESKTVLADRTAPANECGLMCAQQFARLYEPKFGGFSEAPKFPQPVNMNFLFYMYARDPTSQLGRQCLDMCEYTLTKIAYGGIHDHVGQGFARYSVDEEWHVPHFEKMLYDQGQLLQSYTDAFLATKDAFFSEIMDDIVTYVSRDLRHKEGGFYSAEDADSYPTPNEKAKREGAFYVWTQDEINKLLNKEVPGRQDIKMSDVFSRHYEVKSNGNVRRQQDPHGELTTKNVLIQRLPIEDTARHFNISDVTAKDTIKESKRLLFEARSKRPRPNLDNKIITAWNGLMISGLSRAGAATDNKRYVELATDAARFVERYLYDKSERVLLRNCYCDDLNAITQTSVPIKGFHTDYAFMVKGLLDLYEASFDPHWLEFAEELQDTQDNLFWDGANGGYFATAKDDATMILRLKDDHDGAEPCSNSIACDNLLKLSAFLNRSEFKDKAKHLLASFREILMKIPYSIPELVSALLHYHDGTMQIYIIGKRDTKETKDMIEIVRKRLIPAKILIFADHEESDNVLFKKNDVLSKMKSHNGQAMAYVCRHRKCSLPVTNPEELAALVDEK